MVHTEQTRSGEIKLKKKKVKSYFWYTVNKKCVSFLSSSVFLKLKSKNDVFLRDFKVYM